MKKTILCLITIIIVIACQKNNDEIYSCDPIVDNWIKINLDEVKQMTRKDLIKKEPKTQRAIYNVFSPKQRLQLWENKLDEVLRLDWSNDEKSHILTLRNALNIEWFSYDYRKNSTKSEQLDSFLMNWYNDGIINFNWTIDLIKNMLVRTEELIDKRGELKILYKNTKGSGGGKVGYGGKCDCSLQSDWCNTLDCIDNNCYMTLGCGTLWTYRCDGSCM